MIPLHFFFTFCSQMTLGVNDNLKLAAATPHPKRTILSYSLEFPKGFNIILRGKLERSILENIIYAFSIKAPQNKKKCLCVWGE